MGRGGRGREELETKQTTKFTKKPPTTNSQRGVNCKNENKNGAMAGG